jgi:glycosyltransferase involved in cell wall biosynthesis
MAASPRLSVVIPTYNGARYLRGAIASVLAQSARDLELLVLDNASTDDTPALVREFRDPALRYHRNATNLGFRGNVELGRRLARGELVAFIGCDDLWEPDMARRALAFWDARPGLGFMHTATTQIDEDGTPFGRLTAPWSEVTPGREAFVEVFRLGFCLSGMLMPRARLERLGESDPAWGDMLDVWWFLNLSLEGDVGYLPEPLVRFRIRRDSLVTCSARDGTLFRQHLALVSQAFEWPRARVMGLTRHKRRALRYTAAEALKMLHLVTLEGTRRQYLPTFVRVVRAAPLLAALPTTWARFAFGLLPRPAIRGLQRWKRRRAARGTPGAAVLGPVPSGAA